MVKIDGVVQKFMDSRTISEDERESLRDKKVAVQKLRYKQCRYRKTIITDLQRKGKIFKSDLQVQS